MARLLVVMVLLTTLLSACGQAGSAPAADQAGPANRTEVRAVTTVYPLAWMVRRIAPDAALTDLSATGQDVHDVELSVAARRAAEEADVVAHVGDIGFQPQVEEVLDNAVGQVVSIAAVAGEDALLPIAHHEHAGEEENGELDPHLWFDARVMARVAGALGQAFATADPDRADTYTAAASRIAADLEALGDEMAGRLSDCAHDTVIVSHEAYAYLLEPHGLHQEGVSGAGGHAEASPQRIAELVTLIRDTGLDAVLSEPVEGRQDAAAVATEAGVDLVYIYSLDIVTDEQSEAGYPQLLREQTAAVARAASCGTNGSAT